MQIAHIYSSIQNFKQYGAFIYDWNFKFFLKMITIPLDLLNTIILFWKRNPRHNIQLFIFLLQFVNMEWNTL